MFQLKSILLKEVENKTFNKTIIKNCFITYIKLLSCLFIVLSYNLKGVFYLFIFFLGYQSQIQNYWSMRITLLCVLYFRTI